MKLEPSKIVEWKNDEGKKIIWLITDQENFGVVIHSDNLLMVGTLTDLSNFDVSPFIGSVTLNSAKDDNKCSINK